MDDLGLDLPESLESLLEMTAIFVPTILGSSKIQQ